PGWKGDGSEKASRSMARAPAGTASRPGPLAMSPRWVKAGLSEIPKEPLLHAAQRFLERTGLLGHLSAAQSLVAGFLEQAHRGGVARRAHHVGQAAAVGGHADANRLEEDVLGELDHAGQQ